MARQARWWWVLALCLTGALAGCKSKNKEQNRAKASVGDGGSGGAGADVSAVVSQGEALQGEEDDLLKRRNALQRERQTLVENRTQLAEQRKALVAGKRVDRDKADELAKAEEQALDLERKLLETQSEVESKLNELLSKKTRLVEQATVVAVSSGGGNDPAVAAARREVGVAAREKDLAAREKDLAAREKDLSQRELELAKGCVAGGGSTIIMQAPDNPKGFKYGRRDVEPVYQKALKALSEKGILDGDLPPGVANLREDTRKAMESGDYGKAKYGADQLYAVASALKIDRGFVSAKFTRLSSAMKGKSLSGEGKSLFEEATSNYGDGKFSAANSRLNKIFALLR